MRRLMLPLAGLCGFALAVVPALAEDQSIQALSGPDRFEPKEVTVQPGEKVTISNNGGGLHNVHWDDRGQAEMPVGAVWTTERSFPSAGTFRFYCEPHGSEGGVGMSGVVRVEGGAGTTTTPPPGGTTTTPAAGDDGPAVIERVRARGTRRGVRVTLLLSEPATVRARLLRGFRVIGRRTVEVLDELTFRIRRPLRAGRYRLRLVIEDADGNITRRLLRVRVI
jgi:plastocyanin